MARGRKPKETKPSKEDSEHSEVENSDDGEDNNDETGKEKDEERSVYEKPVSTLSRKVMIVSKEIETIGWNNVEQVTLFHPKTQQKALFLIDIRGEGSGNCIFEIMTMEQETRSWFVDESVISDGNLYVATPVDPLFFILPAMMKSHQAMPLRDHLTESIKNTKVEGLLSSRLEGSSEMENIAVKKVLDDIIAFKYSEVSTIEWLLKKVDKVSKFLQKRGISSSESSVSANFTKSSDNTVTVDNNVGEEYLRYACEIVGEYISNDMKKILYEKHNLPFVQNKASKRKSNGEGLNEDGQTKKMKTDTDGSAVVIQPIEDYGSTNAAAANSVNTKLKPKDKVLQKAAKGSQSLFKFFAPKAK